MKHIDYKIEAVIKTSNLISEDGKDLHQEMTLAVLKALPQFEQRSSQENGCSYLNRTADNCLLSILRKRKVRGLNIPTVQIEDCSGDDEDNSDSIVLEDRSKEDFEKHQLILDVHSVISLMPDKLQQMRLLFIADVPFEQMESVLGVKAVTLRIRPRLPLQEPICPPSVIPSMPSTPPTPANCITFPWLSQSSAGRTGTRTKL